MPGATPRRKRSPLPGSPRSSARARIRGIGALPGVALLACAPLAAGCRAFDEGLLDGAVAPDAGCGLARPPSRPMPVLGADVPEMHFALRDAYLEQGAEWRTVGYDLDGLCTDPPSLVSECVPPDPTEGVEPDGRDGIDNVFGHEVAPFVLVLLGGVEGPIRAQQELGRGNPLLRLRAYNGQADDAQVEVALIDGTFGSPALPDGTAPPLPSDGSPPAPPDWMGDDYFWGAPGSFVGGDESAPLSADGNAYVAGRVLVARLPDRAPVVLEGEDLTLLVRLADVVLTARLSPDATRLEEVTLAGRLRIDDLQEALAALGFCPGTPNEERALRMLQQRTDVRAVPGSGGPGASCDALSTGVRFVGHRVGWAGLSPDRPRPSACP